MVQYRMNGRRVAVWILVTVWVSVVAWNLASRPGAATVSFEKQPKENKKPKRTKKEEKSRKKWLKREQESCAGKDKWFDVSRGKCMRKEVCTRANGTMTSTGRCKGYSFKLNKGTYDEYNKLGKKTDDGGKAGVETTKKGIETGKKGTEKEEKLYKTCSDTPKKWATNECQRVALKLDRQYDWTDEKKADQALIDFAKKYNKNVAEFRKEIKPICKKVPTAQVNDLAGVCSAVGIDTRKREYKKCSKNPNKWSMPECEALAETYGSFDWKDPAKREKALRGLADQTDGDTYEKTRKRVRDMCKGASRDAMTRNQRDICDAMKDSNNGLQPPPEGAKPRDDDIVSRRQKCEKNRSLWNTDECRDLSVWYGPYE